MHTFRLLIAVFITFILSIPAAAGSAMAQAPAAPPIVATFVPADGSWTGTTNLGYPVSFTVSGNGTSWTNFRFGWRGWTAYCMVEETITFPGPGSITNNSFSASGGSYYTVTGQFTSAYAAQGTYEVLGHYISGTCGSMPTVSGTWTATVPPPPPGAFSKSAPTNGATNQPLSPTLQWAASNGADSYEYCYDTTDNSTCDGSWALAGTALSASINGLNPTTTYYWQVRAVNSAGATYGNSNTWWSFTTGVPPGAFGKSVPADGSGGQWLSTIISWGSASGATSYQYCYDTTNDSSCSGTWQSAGAGTSAVLNSLALSTTYYWQMRAVNAIGFTEADGGTWWSFTTGATPVAFGKLSPATGATNQPLDLSLAWGSSDATSYAYCADTVNNNVCDGSWVGNGPATMVDPPGVFKPGTTYYWQVRALNPMGFTEADGGSWWSFTTIPPLQLTLKSSGAQDGWILETAENGNVGGAVNAIEPTFTLGDDASRRQYRAILSFNTASIPPTAVVTSATLKIKKASGSPTNPFATHGNIVVDVKKGTFGTSVLQAPDFQAAATKTGVLTIPNAPVSGWYSKSLSAASLTYINRAGLTQFRLRFNKDDDNDRVADFIKFYSGNFATGSARPILLIQYYIP